MDVAIVLPMVDPIVTDNNGSDVVICDNASGSIDGTKEQIDGGAARISAAATDEMLSVESTNDADDEISTVSSTPITRSASFSRPARRKRGTFSLFRTVFLSFNGSRSTKQNTDDASSPKKKAGADNDVDSKPPATSWKSIVDGMRPLRLPGQELEYYPPPPPPPPAAGHMDVFLAPPSPVRSGSEGGMTSRYASAQDLHLLDCGDQEVDEEAAPAAEDGVGSRCPHAIDMQAEEFIAKFYAQFRLQKSECFNDRAPE